MLLEIRGLIDRRDHRFDGSYSPEQPRRRDSDIDRFRPVRDYLYVVEGIKETVDDAGGEAQGDRKKIMGADVGIERSNTPKARSWWRRLLIWCNGPITRLHQKLKKSNSMAISAKEFNVRISELQNRFDWIENEIKRRRER